MHGLALDAHAHAGDLAQLAGDELGRGELTGGGRRTVERGQALDPVVQLWLGEQPSRRHPVTLAGRTARAT
jgi:hypothetical protein